MKDLLQQFESNERTIFDRRTALRTLGYRGDDLREERAGSGPKPCVRPALFHDEDVIIGEDEYGDFGD